MFAADVGSHHPMKAPPLKTPETKQLNTSYFWGPKNVPLLYLFFPLLVVAVALELILVFHGISPVILEVVMVLPSVVLGTVLLNSASKFQVALAEAQPFHYIVRWREMRIIWYVMFASAATLAAYSIIFGTQSLTGGDALVSVLKSLGILYLINAYTMVLPQRFFSPKPVEFARVYVATALSKRDSEGKHLRDALKWFGRTYSKSTGLRIEERILADVVGSDHVSNRNLGLRLQHALQSGNYEDGIQAIGSSISPTREVLLGRNKERSGTANLMAIVDIVVRLAPIMIVLALIILGKIPLDFSVLLKYLP